MDHRNLVESLAAATNDGSLIWRRSANPLDIYGIERVAERSGFRFTYGLQDLTVWGETYHVDIRGCDGLAALSQAIADQEQQGTARLVTAATEALGSAI